MKTPKEQAIENLLKKYSEEELTRMHWEFEHLAKVTDNIAFKIVANILHEAAFDSFKLRCESDVEARRRQA